MLIHLLVAIAAASPPLKIHPDVRSALDRGDAVVALESTIISHGMPYPRNLETARRVEKAIVENGATPATIAVLDGVCCIGLDDDELERFAQLGSEGAVSKLSRRDLAHCVSRGGHGGTTVSCTMLLAHAAGISTFVTGGIGGVHRGGEDSMDLSADLGELGRTPVMVVSAGASQSSTHRMRKALHEYRMHAYDAHMYAYHMYRCQVNPRHPAHARGARVERCRRARVWR